MSPKLIVADAGPLIALAIGGVLPACVAMLGGLYVPEAVLQECTSDPSAPGAAVIQSLSTAGDVHIVPQSVLIQLDAALAQGLGTGELAVLSYAAEHDLLAACRTQGFKTSPPENCLKNRQFDLVFVDFQGFLQYSQPLSNFWT